MYHNHIPFYRTKQVALSKGFELFCGLSYPGTQGLFQDSRLPAAVPLQDLVWPQTRQKHQPLAKRTGGLGMIATDMQVVVVFDAIAPSYHACF